MTESRKSFCKYISIVVNMFSKWQTRKTWLYPIIMFDKFIVHLEIDLQLKRLKYQNAKGLFGSQRVLTFGTMKYYYLFKDCVYPFIKVQKWIFWVPKSSYFWLDTYYYWKIHFLTFPTCFQIPITYFFPNWILIFLIYKTWEINKNKLKKNSVLKILLIFGGVL